MVAAYVSIITALIVAVFGLIGQVVIAKSTANKHDAVVDTKLEAINQKIDKLEVKVDKHNNFMERISMLEKGQEGFIELFEQFKEYCKEMRSECTRINPK